jgi:hypothetical protein
MFPENPEERPLIDWARVLERIETALARWLAQAVEPEPSPPPPAVPPLRLEEQLRRLQTFLDQAETSAASVSTLLAAEAGAMEQWLGNLAAARQKLAEHSASEI